jgi:UDP-N-acetylglucosamine:LPS N-acetylglucosamine transferase
MSECTGLVTTAGFESIAEAMYLQKPVLTIPISGHYEQMCNAIDAQQSGAGLYMKKPDISTFLNYIATTPNPTFTYQNWVNKSEEMMIKALMKENTQNKVDHLEAI